MQEVRERGREEGEENSREELERVMLSPSSIGG